MGRSLLVRSGRCVGECGGDEESGGRTVVVGDAWGNLGKRKEIKKGECWS